MKSACGYKVNYVTTNIFKLTRKEERERSGEKVAEVMTSLQGGKKQFMNHQPKEMNEEDTVFKQKLKDLNQSKSHEKGSLATGGIRSLAKEK